MPVPHHSVFYRPDAVPAAQPTASKHWRQYYLYALSHWNRTVEIFLNFSKSVHEQEMIGWQWRLLDHMQIICTLLQIVNHAQYLPHHSLFYRPVALPAVQPTASKHWRQHWIIITSRQSKLSVTCSTEWTDWLETAKIEKLYTKQLQQSKHKRLNGEMMLRCLYNPQNLNDYGRPM